MWDTDAGDVTAKETDAQFAHEAHVSTGMLENPDDQSMFALLVQAARSIRRDPAKMIERAKQIGGLLGSDGFYRFPMGGDNIEGESIDLAQALAQEWGGIIYQVNTLYSEELASGGRRVHLRASVADLSALVCAQVDQVVSTSPPPGKFAKKTDQAERWHTMQTQSASSKIVRNGILRVLPQWYVKPALEAAKAVDSKAALNGRTLEVARRDSLDAFVQKFGCTQAELETYLGQPLDMWAVPQISALKDLWRSLVSGAQSIEAWRAGLKTEAPTQQEPPRRNALGLPAESSSKPLDLGQQAKNAEPVPVVRTAQPEPVQQQAQASDSARSNVAELVERHKAKGGAKKHEPSQVLFGDGNSERGREPGEDDEP